MVRLPALASTLILLAISASHAQEPDNLKCAERDTTMSIVECHMADTKIWDRRLNAAYQKLMKGETQPQKKQLQDAQRLWVRFRDANCGYYAGGEGTIRQVKSAICRQTLTRSRALELEEESDPERLPARENRSDAAPTTTTATTTTTTKESEVGQALGPAESITVLGRTFSVTPIRLEAPSLPWADVKAYLPAELSVAPPQPLSEREVLARVDQLARERGAAYGASLKRQTDRYLKEFLKKEPKANWDWFNLELADSCLGNEKSPYVPEDTMRLCQEHQALHNLQEMLGRAASSR